MTLSKLIKSGTLGRIVEFETHFDSYRPEYSTDHAWKNKPLAGGGAIYDLGTHLVDQIYHLFGMPKGVTCFLGSHRAKNPTGYEDSFTLLLTYSSGLLATAKVSAVSAEEKQLRFWVRGETGSYKKVRSFPLSPPGFWSFTEHFLVSSRHSGGTIESGHASR